MRRWTLDVPPPRRGDWIAIGIGTAVSVLVALIVLVVAL